MSLQWYNNTVYATTWYYCHSTAFHGMVQDVNGWYFDIKV